MEEQLLEIFREVFNQEDPKTITLDTEFRELDQYTSLTQMEIIMKITERLGVKLKLMPLVKADTIGDILEIIES